MENEIVESSPVLSGLAIGIYRAGAERHARLRDVIATGQILERGLEIATLAAGEKSKTPEVDAEYWNVAPIEKPGSA